MAGRIQPCEYQEESIPGGVTVQTTCPRQTQAVLLKEQSQDGISLEDKGEKEKRGSREGCGWRMLGR